MTHDLAYQRCRLADATPASELLVFPSNLPGHVNVTFAHTAVSQSEKDRSLGVFNKKNAMHLKKMLAALQ